MEETQKPWANDNHEIQVEWGPGIGARISDSWAPHLMLGKL